MPSSVHFWPTPKKVEIVNYVSNDNKLHHIINIIKILNISLDRGKGERQNRRYGVELPKPARCIKYQVHKANKVTGNIYIRHKNQICCCLYACPKSFILNNVSFLSIIKQQYLPFTRWNVCNVEFAIRAVCVAENGRKTRTHTLASFIFVRLSL